MLYLCSFNNYALFRVAFRHVIREMSVANLLWGAPRIDGELLKLGIDVGQTTVANEKAATVARLPGIERHRGS